MGDVSSQEGRSPKLCRKKSGWTVMDPTWSLEILSSKLVGG